MTTGIHCFRPDSRYNPHDVIQPDELYLTPSHDPPSLGRTPVQSARNHGNHEEVQPATEQTYLKSIYLHSQVAKQNISSTASVMYRFKKK